MPRSPIFSDYRTLTEICTRGGDDVPSPLFTVVNNRGQVSDHTLEELQERSLRWGALLASRVQRGDRVILCMPTSLDGLAAFFGTLMAGAIAVPTPYAFTKQPAYLEEYLSTRQKVADDCEAVAILTLPELVDVSHQLEARSAALTHVLTADDLPETAEGFSPVAAQPSDVALLQYTSGSTGHPKGVELTHGNLLWNLHGIGSALQPEETGEGVVSWLPLYHDMGLIGGWLWPLGTRLRHVLMATEVFLTEPTFWLQAMSQIKASITVAPNFGYALAVKRVKPDLVKHLDLSNLRTCICGAEPIDANVMHAFQDKFSAAGLRPHVMLPVYGLAEATLAVTFTRIYEPVKARFLDRQKLDEEGVAVDAAKDDPKALQVVNVGVPLRDSQVRIVDPSSGEVLGDDRQGEIQYRSDSVMRGYWKNAEATAATLVDGGWLRTGDLGFLEQGELYVTGRIKDLIITYGRNFYPHDIEWLAAKVPGIRQGCVAAFGVPNEETSTEEIVVVAETRQTDKEALQGLRREIRRLLIQTIECNPKFIVLVPPRAVPKTTSGKIRRVEAKKLFLSDGFPKLL
jgi:acyl-CoA synthetase (AMP-forming)/AMP-acid ligase II